MTTIKIDQLSSVVGNKWGLYDALYYEAQLHLPPFGVTPLSFLGQVLRGEKHALNKASVVALQMSGEVNRVLTVDVLLKKVLSSKQIM